MPTKAELKLQAQHIKVKIRKNDQVMIISGKDKGQVGFVAAVAPKEQKVIVLQRDPDNPDNVRALNAAIKHRKARVQGEKSARFQIPVPIHISNVMVIDPKSGEPTRVGRKKADGKVLRVSKKSGETIPEMPVMEEKS